MEEVLLIQVIQPNDFHWLRKVLYEDYSHLTHSFLYVKYLMGILNQSHLMLNALLSQVLCLLMLVLLGSVIG